MEERTSHGYYTPAQAAHILRLSPTRVRQLLKSGELEGERDEAGHWTIPAHGVHERLERLRHESFLKAVDFDPTRGPEMRDLVEELRDQVTHLRSQLDVRVGEVRRRDVIISQLTQVTSTLTDRLRELEAPVQQPTPSESGQEAAQEPADAPPGPRRPGPVPQTLLRAQSA
jgi:hypothetical protein